MPDKMFPASICQWCGKLCDRAEVVITDAPPTGKELWCYCEDCDAETFHPIPLPHPARADQAGNILGNQAEGC